MYGTSDTAASSKLNRWRYFLYPSCTLNNSTRSQFDLFDALLCPFFTCSCAVCQTDIDFIRSLVAYHKIDALYQPRYMYTISRNHLRYYNAWSVCARTDIVYKRKEFGTCYTSIRRLCTRPIFDSILACIEIIVYVSCLLSFTFNSKLNIDSTVASRYSSDGCERIFTLFIMSIISVLCSATSRLALYMP